MTEMITLIMLALLASPWLIQYWCARRKHMILEQECRMSEAMAEMEELMLEAEVKKGDLFHDDVYRIMRAIQSRRRYGIGLKKLSVEEARKSRRNAQRLKSELAGSKRLLSVSSKFLSGYIHAARISCPVRFYLAFGYILILIGLLQVFLAALRHIDQAKEDFHTLKQDAKFQLLAESRSTQCS